MSINADENSNNNSLLINFERQFRQLLLESKSNELIIKSTQENLNNCIKQNNLLERELETERLNKSMLKMELETLTSMNTYNPGKNINNSEFDMNVLIHEREYLTNKIFKIQIENMELKQELTKSNCQISELITNKQTLTEQVNLVTSMHNSLHMQIKKFEKESRTLENILCTSKILAKKIVCALKYTKNCNKTQFDHIQQLEKELSTIKSKIHMFIDQNDQEQIIKTDKKNTVSFNQTHMEVCMKLIETLEIENNTLHKSIDQMLENQILKNDTNHHTE